MRKEIFIFTFILIGAGLLASRLYLQLAAEVAARCLLATPITGTVPAGASAVQVELKRGSALSLMIVLP